MNHTANNDGARVRPFLHPRSIAIIGASADETKIGGRPIRYLRLAGYQGPIYPINPGRDVVQGLKSYPSLASVDAEVDLVVIAVPAQDVLAAVEACAAKGVNGAMVFSSGFAEVDEAGRELQNRITEAARRGGVALLGPNCAGTFNVREGLLATFTSGIIDKPPRIGSIGMVSQSGAFGIHMIVLAAERDLGLSMCLTTGNQSDLELSEALAYIVEDPDTEVVIAVIEGVLNPPRLLAAFEAARRKRKPVIVLKLGRSEAGARAAASHTASLAGSDEIFDAILRQNHVYRAYSIDELMDVAYACSLKRFPINDKVGLITVSGGVGILMADQAEAAGLEVAQMPAASQAAIKELLPFAAAGNPVDVTAQVITHPQLVGPMFEEMLTGGGYGSAVCFITHIARNKDLFGKLLPHFEAVARKHTDRFLVLSTLASPETRKHLESVGYAVFEEPGRALKAISALAKFRQAFDAPAAEAAPRVPTGALAVRRDVTYDEFEAKKILMSAGIPCAAETVVTSSDAAADAAATIGFPLVMKIVSPDIQHKSEIGGVLLDLKSADEVRAGYATLIDRAKNRAPQARITGVLLAQQVKGGVETIMGVIRDPVYGPMVMFGLGGVFVEVLKDVTFRRAPFGPSEARRMIRDLKGYAILRGVRGAPPADEEALVQALTRLSAYAAAQGDALESIDVNPFIVLPAGHGALAVDALIQSN
jgi:acyl-CoA synthetase (NDP forming)